MEYPIGEFSKISRLPVKTLRYYHEIGLLHPVRVDDFTGYRYYSEESLFRAKAITQLKAYGFALADIGEILQNCQDDTEMTALVRQKIAEIDRALQNMQNTRQSVKNFLNYLEKESRKMNQAGEIAVKEIPEVQVASIRYRGRYDAMGKYIGTLFKNCGGCIAGELFALYYDPEYREEDADIEVCLPVKNAVNKDGITTRILPGGKFISITHEGGYDTLGSSYKKLFDYVNAHQLKAISPSREVYIKGPGMILKGNPDKYITEILVGVE